MRDVAVIAYARAETTAGQPVRDETELLLDAVGSAVRASGIPRREIGFTVSGSCDFLGGRPFSFVSAIDAVGAWPPIRESHLEMDGAFALYEAWVRLQEGDLDAALVYAFARATQGDLPKVLSMQLDPYTIGPLGADANELAALQANLRGAEVVPAPAADAAAAIVLAAGDRARHAPRRAWIQGIDHRIEPHAFGMRELARSVSTALAARHAGALRAPIDVACLHTSFAHHEAILREALELPATARVENSLAADPVMVTGLGRIGAAAEHVMSGQARRALAHAASGHCLQQNLVCVLGAEPLS